MKNTKHLQLALLSLIAAATSISYAEESQGGTRIVYVGSGPAAKDNLTKSTEAPVSFGFLSVSNTSDSVWGLDFSGEGTKLESNGSRVTVKQGWSYNLALGKNITKGENTRFDAAFLVGMRTTSSSCPTSYLGYQCYADEPPKNSYGFNYGVLATMTYKSVMFGLRGTGESAQALVGFRF